jgi:hypothetical protein
MVSSSFLQLMWLRAGLFDSYLPLKIWAQGMKDIYDVHVEHNGTGWP